MIRCTDQWEPPEWGAVLRALRKNPENYAQWLPRLFDGFRRAGLRTGGPAIDLGCAEGKFTELWMHTLAEEGYDLPSRLTLIEPEAVLLEAAEETLRRAFPDLDVRAERTTAEDFIANRHAHRDLSLLVLSHVIYYLMDLVGELMTAIRDRLAAGGVGWVIVRDNDSGLYQYRSSLIEKYGAVDEHADRFSHYVASELERLEIPHIRVKRAFMLDVEGADVQSRHTVFSFLAHLDGVSLDDIRAMPESAWQFSETHFLLPATSR